MKRKIVNHQAVIETACFVLFGITMLCLLCSGQYLSYVTPRMAPYLCFTAVVMGVWAVVSLKGLFQIVYKKRTGHYFILLIPVMLFLLPHQGMEVANLSGTTGLLTGSAIGSPVEPTETMPSDQGSVIQTEEPEPMQGPSSPEPPSEEIISEQESPSSDVYMSINVYGEPLALHGYDGENRTITVSNEEFYDWLCELFLNMEKLEGFQVTMTGAVYKDPALFAENEFVPARLVMSCCVADLAPCGVVCQYDKADELEYNSWVTVTGTLHRGQYQGQDEPQIQVETIVPAEPVEGYLFPYA